MNIEELFNKAKKADKQIGRSRKDIQLEMVEKLASIDRTEETNLALSLTLQKTSGLENEKTGNIATSEKCIRRCCPG